MAASVQSREKNNEKNVAFCAKKLLNAYEYRKICSQEVLIATNNVRTIKTNVDCDNYKVLTKIKQAAAFLT